MNNKGFTLVEILTVIVIMSLLVLIAIPSSKALGDRTKNKLLQTKLELAQQSAVLWGQDNEICFTNPEGCQNKITPAQCSKDANGNICFNIKLETLAEEGYFEYDNIQDKKIEDPKNKEETLNNHIITLRYNTDYRTIVTDIIED